MRNRADFLQGLVTGLTAGLGLAVLLKARSGRSLTDSSPSLPYPTPRRPYEWSASASQPRKPGLLRERPEVGGNPEMLSPEKSSYSSTPFERLSGAPGSPSGTERINIPGRPGETSDLGSASTGVRPAGRTIHVRDRGE